MLHEDSAISSCTASTPVKEERVSETSGDAGALDRVQGPGAERSGHWFTLSVPA